ncbi:heterokaryon incompatibility protein-domain-containing protein [Echria macrotheca]|uniref:Heterokaryon incompatibility protein-domain-containing protein n=1 Tax=Echria macrotheca TaxID=438768 RepID=A0AAJ0B218_9PEZI|nr:heterokaryon incompatibility protein-domain-containing protein [Echria macrotheca]
MRLLNVETRKLEEFYDNIPAYSILSHRWGDGEVLFQDIQSGTAASKPGYAKLLGACELAASHGFWYIWIDTCCIDKTSSAELSEAINSMYRWYQNSTICYAYLADVDSSSSPEEAESRNMMDLLRSSNWFTRGWTLQELIAPSIVVFYDTNWIRMGTRSALASRLSVITGIPGNILENGDISGASVAQKMSWASMRTTTRTEDMAYCLLGLFGVNMPMLYGEGDRAFVRLQEEILKISDDHSIFAWGYAEPGGDVTNDDIDLRAPEGVLARSPEDFEFSGNIVPSFDTDGELDGTIQLNNKGVHLTLPIKRVPRVHGWGAEYVAALPCVFEGNKRRVGISIQPVPLDKGRFRRIGKFFELNDLDMSANAGYSVTPICFEQTHWATRPLSLVQKAGREILFGHGYPLDGHLGNEKLMTTLVHNGASLGGNIELTFAGSRTLLTLALEHRDDAAVEKLLAYYDDSACPITEVDGSDNSPLSMSVAANRPRMTELLLQKGADPNDDLRLWCNDLPSPLIMAIRKGERQLVEILLRYGADPNLRHYAQSPIESARGVCCEEEIVKLLIAYGAEP